MANWNKPDVDSNYEDFPDEVRAIAINAAKLDYTGDANIPDGVIQLNRSTKRFELRASGSFGNQDLSGAGLVDGTVTLAKLAAAAMDGDARTDLATVAKVQDSSFIYGGTSGGTANAQTLACTPAITAYAAGQVFVFLAGATNTGAPTINVNGVGDISVYRSDGSSARAGDIVQNQMHVIVKNSGSAFTLLNPGMLWAAYTPTVTPALGSVGSESKNFRAQVDLNNKVNFEFVYSAVMSGSSNNQFGFTLPFTAANSGIGAFVGMVLYNSTTTAPCYGILTSTSVLTINTPTISTGGAGFTIYLTGSYKGA